MQINWRAPDLTDKNDRIMRLDTRAFLCYSVGAALFLMGGSVLFGLAFGGHISVPVAIAVGAVLAVVTFLLLHAGDSAAREERTIRVEAENAMRESVQTYTRDLLASIGVGGEIDEVAALIRRPASPALRTVDFLGTYNGSNVLLKAVRQGFELRIFDQNSREITPDPAAA